MPDEPVLVCTGGPLKGRSIPVPEGGLDIGRAEENDVVLPDDGASRFHARLLFDNGTLWLRDCGSRNGVFVNGVRVTDHKSLKMGDSLTVSNHEFAIRWSDEKTSDDTTEEQPEDSEEAQNDEPKRSWWPFGK